MGYAEKRDDYWRGRYKLASGKYGTVKDDTGATMRFHTRREAQRAADEAEVKERNGIRRNPAAGRVTFGEYVNAWYARQDLAASTMQNYRRHIEDHLLPAVETHALVAITAVAVRAWDRPET